jgi:SAM-dependent methyltransferase
VGAEYLVFSRSGNYLRDGSVYLEESSCCGGKNLVKANAPITADISDLPPDELVRQLNLIYHEVQASVFDRIHSEIWIEEAPVFRELVTSAGKQLPPADLSVLDFGCGTGFAAYQTLSVLGTHRVSHLCCCDQSAAMLEQCKKRILPLFPRAEFSLLAEQLLDDPSKAGRYDLVITNAVLHHILDWQSLLRKLLALLRPGGFYLMGQEPSSRFTNNREIQEAVSSFRREWRWRKYFVISRWVSAIRRRLPPNSEAPWMTSVIAKKRGLIKRRLSRDHIQAIVDFHVPNPVREDCMGFDLESMKIALSPGLSFVAAKAYGFFFPLAGKDVSVKWRRKEESLAEKYPMDGANFSALWCKA